MNSLLQAAILYNLKLRHIQEKPYTRTGDVIVAMNPYKWYRNLYHPEQQYYYANKLLWNDLLTSMQRDVPPEHKASANRDVSPHVYETSTLSYKGMALWGRPQSILVSGESGAGKTVTTKIVLNYFAMLSKIAEDRSGREQSAAAKQITHDGGEDGGSNDQQIIIGVEQQVVDSNPILEAFGNARTIRNDNSSRFGKFIDIRFSSTGKLTGASIDTYLLEKVRLIRQAEGERNFHVFYQFLESATKEERERYHLGDMELEDFALVNQSGTYDRRDMISDVDMHTDMMNAMVSNNLAILQ